MDPLTFLCFSVHTTTSMLPSYLRTVPEAIVSLLCFFLALLYFHMLHTFLFNLSFSSRFLMVPSLTPLTPHLFIYPSLFLAFNSPSSAVYPLASPPFAMSLPFSLERTGEENLTTDFSAFTCSQNLRRERNLCTSGAFIASGGMCCGVHTEKRIWSDWNFWGQWENLSYFGL